GGGTLPSRKCGCCAASWPRSTTTRLPSRVAGRRARSRRRATGRTMPDRPILFFDSGIGGLTVLREARILMPGRRFVYVADEPAFPYRSWQEAALRERLVRLFGGLIRRWNPALIVIACNTASTLAIHDLRAAYPQYSFVGTVPAIKPAAERTRSGLVSVLATPGTVERQYTHD